MIIDGSFQFIPNSSSITYITLLKLINEVIGWIFVQELWEPWIRYYKLIFLIKFASSWCIKESLLFLRTYSTAIFLCSLLCGIWLLELIFTLHRYIKLIEFLEICLLGTIHAKLFCNFVLPEHRLVSFCKLEDLRFVG